MRSIKVIKRHKLNVIQFSEQSGNMPQQRRLTKKQEEEKKRERERETQRERERERFSIIIHYKL